ncbi:MAG TPA: type II toxin-antitoxin system HicB family antitoxin [Prolixibacteraceae bacterium]|nr:type II toxin-antitoxin system HicB family antitoxin [Prolixibacteraceae bacterium]
MQADLNKVKVIIEKSDDGFWVTVEDLPGCYSFGKSTGEALDATGEAISDHISGLKESGEKVPEMFCQSYDFEVKYDLQSLFESFPFINKSALAQMIGINPGLLRQYAKGLAFAGEKQREKIEKALHRIGEELLQVHL